MKATRKTTSRKSARTNGSASGKKWKRDQDKACSPGAWGTLPVAGLEEVELPHRHLLARRDRVVAGEAGVAEVRPLAGEGVHAGNAQVRQRVGAEVRADLRHRVRRGDQLRARRRVDAVEAGVRRRRRADAHVDLAGPRLPDHGDELLAGRP